jgi:flagellar hook assembly protein FlgD
LRKTAVAIAFMLVATFAVMVPSVAAASGDAKVVIIVGATHSATAGYRADADRAYAEAIKYTSNVVKVYSPNATWAKVKAAVVGASLVIYMGHGNGWPSPYTFDAKYTTKDGFGLNATAGNGDYNNKYYGEPYVSTLDLAPNAVVLLNHLCYASGNSEPGNAEPSVSVARQRADNYAAGFLKAGASAVIADGHAGAESYIRALFTTHQSVEDMWRNMPFRNGHTVSFRSGRTSGTTVYQDPETPTSGFYRSLAVHTLGVTTDEVVSGGYGDTSADPVSLVVPGNAAVRTDGAGLYGDLGSTSTPTTTLPAGTRLHVIEQPLQASDTGATLVEVVGLDDPTIAGYMLASDLAARDSTAPVVRVLDPGAAFSPNGDGQRDTASLRGRFTESVAWTLRIHDGADHEVFATTGTGSTFEVAWNGKDGSGPVPDGIYSVSLSGVDPWGNSPARATRQLTVDTQGSDLAGLTPGATTTQWFSPNGDGVRDTVSLTATNREPGSVVTWVLDGAGTVVRKWIVANASAPVSVIWNGKTTAGAYAPDGTYSMRVAATDIAGNTGPAVERTVNVVGALRSVATTRTLFFPQDLDRLDRTTALSFTLARPMTVTWTLRNAAGQTVMTHLDAVALPAGTQSWAFYGRQADGAMLPRGHYTSYVYATDGTLAAAQAVAFDMDAFRVKLSDTTPKRGQSITVTVTSAETLATSPTLFILQPRLARWSVRLTKISAHTYRATIRFKTSGTTGKVSLRVKGIDTSAGVNYTTVVYPLH